MSVGNGTRAETASSRGYTLIDVLEPENVAAAWKKVKANKGKPGIDGMQIGDFPDFMREHWETLRVKLEEGTYKPSPVRRVEIPKDGGGKRVLGIPTVRVHYRFFQRIFGISSDHSSLPSAEWAEFSRSQEATLWRNRDCDIAQLARWQLRRSIGVD